MALDHPVVFDITTRRGRERVREVWTGVRVAELDVEQIGAARGAGYEPGEGEDGRAWFIGRDPREMTQDELRGMGHEPMSPMAALRARCLDCCAGSSDEVRKCVAVSCVSWPFRTGKNPWREVSEGRREVGRRLAAQRAAQRAAKSSDLKSDLSRDDGTPAPVPWLTIRKLRSEEKA